jgi:hypothetical protein
MNNCRQIKRKNRFTLVAFVWAMSGCAAHPGVVQSPPGIDSGDERGESGLVEETVPSGFGGTARRIRQTGVVECSLDVTPVDSGNELGSKQIQFSLRVTPHVPDVVLILPQLSNGRGSVVLWGFYGPVLSWAWPWKLAAHRGVPYAVPVNPKGVTLRETFDARDHMVPMRSPFTSAARILVGDLEEYVDHDSITAEVTFVVWPTGLAIPSLGVPEPVLASRRYCRASWTREQVRVSEGARGESR